MSVFKKVKNSMGSLFRSRSSRTLSCPVLDTPSLRQLPDLSIDSSLGFDGGSVHGSASSSESSSSSQDSTSSLHDFIVLRRIGMGMYGKVHLVRNSIDDSFYALKAMKKSKITRKKKGITNVNREAQLLRYSSSPFIVTLYASFQDTANLYFVMELVQGGDLHTLLNNRRAQRTCFSVSETRFYASEVALALGHLHSHKIIFRDLKPENILIAADGHIKLADFGFATRVDSAYSLCGTPEYMAPEILLPGPDGYTAGVDWYALGVLIFEMLSGDSPFPMEEDTTFDDLADRILDGIYSLERWPGRIDCAAEVVICDLMAPVAERRLGCGGRGVEEVMEHEWFARVDWEQTLMKQVAPPVVPCVVDPGDTSAFTVFPDDDGITAGMYEVSDPYFPNFDYSRW